MEGHAAMDMSAGGSGSFGRRLLSPGGYTAVAHVFVMEWAAILRDLVVGLLALRSICTLIDEPLGGGAVTELKSGPRTT